MNTKHWNWIQGFALAALLPLFAACSSEGDELLQGEEKQPVQVNITRAATDGNDWSWQDNDQIKMNITPYGGTATEYILTYQNGNWNNTALGEMTLPATVNAWWPNTNNASHEKFTYENVQDTWYQINGMADINGSMSQNTVDLYRRSDWMTTDVNTQITSSALSLNMKHRLCKVTVKIVGFEGWDTNPTMENIRFFGKDNNNLSGTATPSDYIDIIPLQITTTDNHTAYTAFISSYDYSGIYILPLMKFTIDSVDYIIYTPENIGNSGFLELGYAYNFNLKVVRKGTNTTTRSVDTSECELELVKVEDMNKN